MGRMKLPGFVRVIATDDVEVVSVSVSLRTAAGAELERGPGAKVHGIWRYPATVAVPPGERVTIHATATDRPGHEGVGEVVYP